MAELGGVVGIDHVWQDDEAMSPYRQLMDPVETQRHRAIGAVAPADVKELAAVLRTATRYQVPLWPVSTGRNFGYGSASPATPGQLVLDLKRMNRILAVDPVLGTALLEPGVTYHDLQAYLQTHKLPLWLDFPGPGPIVSPMGNTLERGNGVTPYGDHFGHSCGMEVMLADGSLVRTGMGGLTAKEGTSSSWQAYRYGYGPVVDGLFSQSNLGVVTKIGLWLMPAPAAHRSFAAVWQKEGDLARAVDTLRTLRVEGLIKSSGVFLNSTLALVGRTTQRELHPAGGAVPHAVLTQALAKNGIGAWTYLYTLYGRTEQVAVDTVLVQQALEACGAQVVPDIVDPAQINQLSLQCFEMLNWTGGGGLAWFSPVCPAIGTDAVKQYELARRITAEHGFDFMQGTCLNGRSNLNVIPLLWDRRYPSETQRAHTCFGALLQAFGAEGYGVYRTGIGFMDQAADAYGPSLRRLNNKLKRALDPKGILAPGKSGIHA
jgi:4-cresol dehydrogenase (hydroxylating)